MIPISSAETEANSKDTFVVKIERKAIDSSGRLGSLYDGCRDCLVGQLSVNNQEELFQPHQTVSGEIVFVNDDQPQNLLRSLRINEQLRLSILLRLAPSTGLGSLIDYPHLINEYTRLFCYSYVNREQRLPDKIIDADQFVNLSMSSSAATHIITGIQWGIDLVVILQLPSDAIIVKEIDLVLSKLLTFLLDDSIDYTLTQKEESLLKKIDHTKVYSNSPDLNNLTTILDVCRSIKGTTSRIIHYPISYTLRSIKWLYPQYNVGDVSFIHLPEELNDNVEEYVLQLTAQMKKLEISVVEHATKLQSEESKEKLADVEKQWSDVKDKFKNEIERLTNLVIEFRSGQVGNSVIQDALSNSEQTVTKNSINHLLQTLNDPERKEHVSSDLDQESSQQLNVSDNDMDQTDTGMTVEQNRVEDDSSKQLLCSNDDLNKSNREQPQTLCSHFVEEFNENSSLNLFVNDQMSSSLSAMVHTSTSPRAEAPISMPPLEDVDITTTPPPLPMSTDKSINILLLGETGVGKSTFINAFANYLAFNTLQEAQTGQPVVIIPVSFLITTGDNFEEHIVKFGLDDGLNNEDFNHPGQSVTQHCKSHILHCNYNHGINLRIIDTPGFGDTRGVNQDDLNMHDIIKYIETAPHIDAVCFLLKPNEPRLNIRYRTCIMQLITVLGSSIGNNIIFCFTNARSTFYTPGDTAPLLRKMLTISPMDSVLFKKDNTFCFDSESFRYLVALQNEIQFGDLEKEEYEMSWTKSVVEAKRLIEHLLKKTSCGLNGQN